MLEQSAIISDCGAYRYRLERRWAEGPLLPFIMLNPSTADASIDDPTIRRCIGFAKREGAAGIVVGNLFAYRATDPKALKSIEDCYGPENEKHTARIVIDAVRDGMPVVCAWGSHDIARPQFFVEWSRVQGARLVCLGMTLTGAPKHPLYISADQPLIPFMMEFFHG